MKNYIIAFFAALLCLAACAEKPTQIVTPDPPTLGTPGKRDYVWTVDTLYYPYGEQTSMESIWGSSATNVYAAGHEASGSSASMWKYDGKSWQKVGLNTQHGGVIEGPFDLHSVQGFDSTTIYAVGSRLYQTFSQTFPFMLDSSFIIKFDGKQWREEQLPARAEDLTCLTCDSKQNIWCGGYRGSIYHFDGLRWSLDTSAKKYTNEVYTNIGIRSIGVTAGQTMAMAMIFTISESSRILMSLILTDSGWAQSDSFVVENGKEKFGPFMWTSPSNQLYSSGSFGMYQYDGKSWNHFFQSDFGIWRVFGLRNEHIFAVGNYCSVFHFNGRDWSKISIPSPDPTLCLYGVWCTENEVFIVGHDDARSYVFHGK